MQNITSLKEQKHLLPILLILAGATVLAAAVGADLVGLSASGFSPTQLSLALSGFAVLIAGIGLVSANGQRHIAEWLLVGVGAIAVAVAADLFVIGGLPGFGAKLLMLVSVAFGIVVTSAMDRQPDEWLKAFTFDRLKAAKFLSIVAQLGLLVLVILQFELENQAFYHNIMLLVFYGFFIHYFLPLHYRLPFFLLLSLAAIFGILGLLNGAWLVGIGLMLIAIGHLPIPFFFRVALLLAAGVTLALLRAEWLPSLVPGAIWPILGSIFMFRFIIYLYDLKHSKEPANLWRSLAYFFLLPNVVFPFFPVVDFATFRRTYYDEERFRIYQRGVEWIFRGIFQLILYRFVNYYLVMAPEDVTTAPELVRFTLTTFLLYFRLTGQFHLVIGLLHLFGFNLPLTNNNYFLSSSFTDLWRRANIYWKDFMQKIFFYPALFKLNKLGDTGKLIVATAFVFVATWFLHAYQWFWLRGTFLLSVPDIVFWTILAILVITNSVREARRGRQRRLGQQSWGIRDIASLGLRTAATVGLLTILWTLWTSSSIADWLALWSIALSIEGIITLVLAFLAMAVVLGIGHWIVKKSTRSALAAAQPSVFFRTAAVNSGLILLVLVIGMPAVYGRIGGQAETVLADLQTERLSDRDANLLLRGYYENLLGVSSFNNELWEVYSKRPSDWPLIQDTSLAKMTDDFYIMDLTPSTQQTFHGAQFTTNRWGMRDQEYEKAKAPGTYRIVVLGPSFVMGSGVADNEIFEALLEDRLNRENSGEPYSQYELLNFGVSGYSALQELYVLDTEALDFEPNAIIFVAHQLEEKITVRNFANRIQSGSEIPYDYLRQIAAESSINPEMTASEAERLMTPYGPELVSWTYQQVVARAKEKGVVPIWVFVPTLESPLNIQEKDALEQTAQAAGFITVDLSDLYEGQDISSLIVAEWDKHPNAKGHSLIAENLYQALQQKQDLIPLGLSPEAP
jgi:hypothetical protein